jgi:hypothetical protein
MKNRAIQPRRLGKVAFYGSLFQDPPKKPNKKRIFAAMGVFQHPRLLTTRQQGGDLR